jgi:hypothetical protein
LATWLRDNYQPSTGPEGFDIWMKKAPAQ